MIKKTNKEFKIIEKEEKAVFTLSKSNSDKISIYQYEMVEKLFDTRFNDKYKDLLMMVTSVCNEDSTDSDAEIALIRLAEFKNTILNRYAKYISKEKLSKYLEKVVLLENKISMSKTKSKGR